MARLRGIFGKMADADSGSGEKERKAEVIVGKPIDIMIAVDKNKGVSFACEGHPVITFESLIQGKEIIIGNGFVKNEGAEALPEIRIVCEFEPAIVDTGILYYQDGTFEGGFEGIFDIDDLPVNLEEYAKIKKAKKGKIKFTLYFGETQLGMAECVMGIKPAPEEELKSLMTSISYEQEKNSSGPVNVFLYAKDDGRFEMDLMRQPELLYSMYSNGREQLIGDVCKYELKNAVCLLLQENGPMTKEELTKALVQLFGYSRSSRKLEEGAAAAIRAAKELKAIDIDEKKRYFLL